MYYLGIDIGGTYIRMIKLKGFGRQRPQVLKTRSSQKKRHLEKILQKQITVFLGNETKNLKGVGVSVAGIVERESGKLLKVNNIPSLDNWNIKRFFSYLGAPVRIDNDARCFLLAEMKWGIGRGRQNIAAVAIGTGIGGAIAVNGHMLRGAHHSAGEVGFLVMGERPVKFFEDLAAKKAYQKLGDRSETIGLGVVSIINALDPEIVILGGGATQSEDFHMGKVVKTARAYTINPLAKKTPIVKGVLGEGAQAIGAALLFAEK